MKKAFIFFFVVNMLFVSSCSQGIQSKEAIECSDSISYNFSLVERVDTNGLLFLFPSFSYIDLRCGNIPQTSEKDVILFAEAAYTGAPLEKIFGV